MDNIFFTSLPSQIKVPPKNKSTGDLLDNIEIDPNTRTAKPKGASFNFPTAQNSRLSRKGAVKKTKGIKRQDEVAESSKNSKNPWAERR